MTDVLEILDLRDCLLIEQEEKNELNKKLQDVEKECESVIAFQYSNSSHIVTSYACLNIQNCLQLKIRFLFFEVDSEPLNPLTLDFAETWQCQLYPL